MEGTKSILGLNLQWLSMASIAERLWHAPEIRTKVKHYFSNFIFSDPGKIWYDISELVVSHGYVLGLPSTIVLELKKLIVIIGEKIYKWIYYLTQELKLDFIFAEKIYFDYGSVNEKKIFDLYWRRMPADTFKKHSNCGKHTLYSLACVHWHERFINEHKSEMLEDLSEFYMEVTFGSQIYNIMSIYICLAARKSVAENISQPQRMFEMCLEKGFSKAARYYWSRLIAFERVSKLTSFAEQCFQHTPRILIREGYCENLLFLIQQMHEEEKSEFFANYADKIIMMFLKVWPYQEMIVPLGVLEHDWEIDRSRSMDVLKCLFELRCPVENELLFQIIQKAWTHIMAESDDRRNFVTVYFFQQSDFTKYVKKSCLELVKMGKFNFINELTEKLLNFGPKPKELVKKDFPFFVTELIEKNKFGLINQILDWSAESEEERERLKNETNPIKICRRLTEELLNFDLANEFLKWRFETDEKIKNFKEEMKCCDFVMVDFGKYLRIKSGDLSHLTPGDTVSIHCDYNPFDNVEGLMLVKPEEANKLNGGFVVGIPGIRGKCSTKAVIDFRRPESVHITRSRVVNVGTKPGDYIFYTVCDIWKKKFTRVRTGSKFEMVEKFCNGFIKFYYETDEEVLEFKKSKFQLLHTENAIDVLYDLFIRGDQFCEPYALHGFLKFFQIPSEKIEQFKKHFGKMMDLYVLDLFD